MKRAEVSSRLLDADQRSLWAFTCPSFDMLLGGVDPNYLKLMMKRLADQRVLMRASKGIYVNPLARSMPRDVRRGLIRFFRPREVSYVSLETKLSEAGVISQVATALTCMTTGSPGTFRTPWGFVEFTHTEREIDAERDVYVADDGTLEATTTRAARDLRRVGRNLGLIDPATLAEVIREEDMHDQSNQP